MWLVTVAVAAIGILGFAVHRATQTEMALLYGGLEEAEAGKITAALGEKSVPFKVSSGGRIMVPRERVAQLRVELATAGLPQGGVGFELFDSISPFGLSEFSEKIAFERARSGELARTISSLDPIKRAVVHIVEPSQSLFLNKKQAARASVVVRLRGGATLSPQQVQGIQRIVAGAVSGLALDEVSVLDERGNPLGGLGAKAAGSVDLVRSVEASLARKAQQVLDAVAGRSGAVVQISASLDLDRVEETHERYDADNKVIRRETSRTRERRGPSGSGGTTGASSKVSGNKAGGGGQSELEETSDADYAIPRTVQRILRNAGAVKRLSVALLVDERHQDRLPELERLVKRAVGFQESRGDAFESVATALDPGELETPEGFSLSPALVGRLIEGGISLFAVLALVLIVRSLRPTKVEAPVGLLPVKTEAEAVLEREVAQAEQERLALAEEEDRLAQEGKRTALLQTLATVVAEHPVVATAVIRRWLHEGNTDEGEEGEA